MNHLFILITILFSIKTTNKGIDLVPRLETLTKKNSQQNTSNHIKNILYEGTLDGKTKISLYINEQEHPCGGDMTILNSMCKYKDHKKWLLLSVTEDVHKTKYCMVEDNFTGVLFLEKDEDYLKGHWISPNIRKKYILNLKKVELKESDKEELDEILFDDLLYNKNDC